MGHPGRPDGRAAGRLSLPRRRAAPREAAPAAPPGGADRRAPRSRAAPTAPGRPPGEVGILDVRTPSSFGVLDRQLPRWPGEACISCGLPGRGDAAKTRRPLAGIGRRSASWRERDEEAAARFRWFVGFAGCWLRLLSEILDVCTPRRGHKRPRSQHGSPATPATTAQTGQTGPPAHPSPPGTGPTRQRRESESRIPPAGGPASKISEDVACARQVGIDGHLLPSVAS